jgi:hypothetical protein
MSAVSELSRKRSAGEFAEDFPILPDLWPIPYPKRSAQSNVYFGRSTVTMRVPRAGRCDVDGGPVGHEAADQ